MPRRSLQCYISRRAECRDRVVLKNSFRKALPWTGSGRKESGAKAHALQTLARWSCAWNLAKRLECVRFSAALRTPTRFMDAERARNSRLLGVPRLRGPDRLKAEL